ncbi:glutathione hydrolase 1 proenzyme-like [Actinia tenebrosa]|uniref:Glutathione hydrolase 1 proenzyme-like n=1 Tax=Actinia tenebrosa TaxID=6105 RepID=A0A6P8IH47_ACTTE|nr:glutathione hydrolase 1 proenzyme-like [Actinia tenebrosa]
MAMNAKDRKIVVFVLVFSALIILGIGFGIGFATRSKTSKNSGSTPDVKTPTSSPTGRPTNGPTSFPTPSGNGTSYGPYKEGAVATDAGKCSEIGRDILKAGGSAVDAAIASSFCIGVINMHSAGIGGGGFMLIYNKSTGRAETLDYREEAPKAATPDMFQNISSTNGGKASGIPGEVIGLYTAHQKYGRLNWSDLVQPSIDLATNGFPIPIPVYEAMELSKEDIKKDPGLKQLLFNGEEMKKLGERITNPQLAITLEKIRDNAISFYNGCLAVDIVRDVKRAEGIITKEDLKDYKPKWKEALKSNMSADLSLFTTAPPSSGAVITLILNILKGYNMSEADRANDEASARTYHRIIEAFKHAYAARAHLGDPDFPDPSYVNIYEVLKNMSNPSIADNIRLRIDDNKTYHNASFYGKYFSGTGHQGTSHLSVLAPNGDAVSLTTTINFRFGAKYRSPVTGIIYNNEMDDFSTPGKPNGFGVKPSPSNYIKPGKRPMSSISPVIFVQRNDLMVRLIAGASGGTRITTATALVIMNKLWFGRPLNESVSEPRVHNQLSNTTYEVKESKYTLPASIRKGLAERGNYLIPSNWYAVVQAIYREEKSTIFAQSDPRKHGWSAGY